MTTENVKIRTEDVKEIFDTKILTTSSHSRLDVIPAEPYDSVLAKIAARSPTADEKAALEATEITASSSNWFITYSELVANLEGRIPWKTIGPTGSGADYIGDTEEVFRTASSAGDKWLLVLPGTYTFSSPVLIPTDTRINGAVISGASGTIITGKPPYFRLRSDTKLTHMTLTNSSATTLDAPMVEVLENNVEIDSVVFDATQESVPPLLSCNNGIDNLKLFDCSFTNGECSLGSGATNSFVYSIFVDNPYGNGLTLTSASNFSLTGSIFNNGVLNIVDSYAVRICANHLEDGVSLPPWGSEIILRANTPKDLTNNESDDFSTLLQYIGASSVNISDPAYASNYAGLVGQDLTSRASALDLLLQWRYEDRNILLFPQADSCRVTWDGTSISFGALKLQSAHRASYWGIPALAPYALPDGWAIYVELDRTLGATPIDLEIKLAPLGSIPNDSDSRQVYTLLFRYGTDIWYRGGGGTRLINGVFFADGSSESFLTFIGMTDYNDSTPNYASNFAGVNGDPLTTRAVQLDRLTRRLFEYSGLVIKTNGVIRADSSGAITLTAPIEFLFPNNSTPVTLAAGNFAALSTGKMLYLQWNQSTMGSATMSSAVNFGTMPLADNYDQTIKYFFFAQRVGNSIFLWDGTEIPLSTGLWPVPSGRAVVRSAPHDIALSDNIEWNPVTSTLRWSNIAVAVETGLSFDRNAFPQTSGVGSMVLNSGYAAKVSHTWNDLGAATVTVTAVSLPLTSVLAQNEFLWVYNNSGTLAFVN